MKKSFGIVALLSCVLLTGCSFEDLKFWEKIDFEKLMFWKKDEEKESVEKKITVSELPKTVVGSELDLTQYVKCEGGNGDFTIQFSEESGAFAKVDATGKKISADHSGEVSFKVNYDGISEDAKASFVSQEYVNFLEKTKDIGYNYGIYGTDDYGNLSSYTNFGENYYYEAFENEGMVEIGGKVYSFGISGETVEDIEIFYSITGYEPDSIEDYTSEFCITEEMLKCEYVPAKDGSEAYEALVIDDHDAVCKLCELYFGYSAELVEKYYKLHSIEILEDALLDDDGNEYPIYDLLLNIEVDEGGVSAIYYLGWNVLDVSEEANMVSFLSEKFKTEVPHGQDASAFFSVIDQALSGHNFTVEYEAGWVTYNKKGQMVEVDENPFVTPETEEIGYYVNHYLMASELLYAYVTESQTYIENGEAAYSEGLVAHEGKVYSYVGESYEASLLSDSASSIFDEELKTEAYNYSFLKTDNGDSLLESAFINDVFEDQYGTGFQIGGDVINELFGKLFYYAIPMPAEMEDLEDDYEWIQQYNDIFYTASFLYEEEFAKYMVCEVDFFFDGEVLNGILFNFVWQDEDDNGTEYDYLVSAYFSEFGTTEIPEEVVVSYPEE